MRSEPSPYRYEPVAETCHTSPAACVVTLVAGDQTEQKELSPPAHVSGETSAVVHACTRRVRDRVRVRVRVRVRGRARVRVRVRVRVGVRVGRWSPPARGRSRSSS